MLNTTKKICKLSACFVLAVLIVFTGGCAGKGAKRLPADRYDYGYALSNSNRSQNLLNIIKLRYLEWPLFLDVDSLATAYTWEQTPSAKFILKSPFGPDPNIFEAAYINRFQERPTVLYRPVSGAKFVRTILTPPSPGALFALIQTGWPADKLFHMTVQSVNGYMNEYPSIDSSSVMEVEFRRFVKLIRKLQQMKALKVAVSRKEGKEGVSLGIRTNLLDSETRQELDEVKNLIGLDSATDSYRVVWDVESRDPGTISVQTRFILQIMVSLTPYVEIPVEDIESGRAARLDPLPVEDDEGLGVLMRIHSGSEKPEDAFVTVTYRNHWYWIDDTDIKTKQNFAFLEMILNIATSGDSKGSQLVISTD